MEFRLRNIDDDVWKDFKMLCLDEKTDMNTKVKALILKEVQTYRKGTVKKLQDKLDDLRQNKLI